MTDAEKILRDAVRRRCRLTPCEVRLRFECPGGIDLTFEKILTLHKPELIALLTNLRCTAKAILRGDFDGLEVDAMFYGMDGETYAVLCEQMESNHLDSLCRRALDHLRAAVKQTPNQHRNLKL